MPDPNLFRMYLEWKNLKLLAKGSDAQIARGPVFQFMTTEVRAIPPEMDIYFAAGLFLKHEFRRFLVVSDGKLVGAITRFDILRAIGTNRILIP